MLRRSILLFILVHFGLLAHTQNLGVNEDGSNPDPSAILDVKSSDKGILIPRININDVNSASPVTSPANGLLVFNEGGSEPVGFYYWDALTSKWILIGSGGSSSGPWDRTAPNVYLINASDSVGLGTNSPEAKLHVNLKSDNIGILIKSSSLPNNTNPLILVTDDVGGEYFRVNADQISNMFVGNAAGENNNGGFNTSLGALSLRQNLNGESNTSVGFGALSNNTNASKNTAVGTSALFTQSFGNGGTSWDAENTAIGFEALMTNNPINTNSGRRNVAIGNLSLRLNSYGANNTAVGYNSLSSNTVGSINIALGSNSLLSNNSGSGNIAIGDYSLNSNVAIGYEIAIGANAMLNASNINLSAIPNNIAIGFNALRGSTSPANNFCSDNIAIGASSLLSNSSGSRNVTIGTGVLTSNTTGNNNSSIGFRSLQDNTTGNNNNAHGYLSLENNTSGVSNIAMGSWSLASNTIGNGNVAIGTSALYSNITNGYSVAIGHEAMYYADNGSSSSQTNNIGIGFRALRGSTTASANTGLNNIAIGANALINITSGYMNFALGTSTLTSLNSGGMNIGIGYNNLNTLSNALGNTSIGYQAGNTVSTGNYNTFLGYSTDLSTGTFTNCVAIGGNGNLAIAASNRVRIGNASITSIGGQVAWTTVSDARLKSNVQNDVVGLNFIMKLNPVTYQFKIDDYNNLFKIKDTINYEGKYDIEKIKFSGFLAQEVEVAAKASGYDFSGIDKPGSENDIYGLRYSDFVVPMVKAMQEQQVMIEDLKTQLQKQQELLDQYKKLEKEMENIKKELNAFKK